MFGRQADGAANVLTLALETSSISGSVALLRGGTTPWEAEVLATATTRVSNAHGESLLTVVEHVLRSVWPERAAHDSLKEIELFAVGIGPGSFTGTRIGVATAKGLAMGAGRAVRGIDAFSALAAAVPTSPSDVVGVVIDARKSEVYLGIVDVGAEELTLRERTLHVPVSEGWARLGALADEQRGRGAISIVVGDGLGLIGPTQPGPWPATHKRLGPLLDRPHAIAIGALAAARQRACPVDEVDDLEPLYVRPPDITVSTRFPPPPGPACASS